MKDKQTRKRKVYRLLSIPVTVIAVLLAHFLKTPNPMMILIIPVVFFAYSDGYIGGTLSGLVAILYSLYFFSNADQLFTYNSQNIQKVLTIVFAVASVVLLVGKLKERDNRNAHGTAMLNSNFLKILSGMDVQLLVTDFDTDEILFANEKMNRGYEIDYDPLGLPCWQVYHGLTERCDFCPKGQLVDNPEPIEWEYQNARTGHWFHNRESTIQWTDGRRVHLQQAVDVTRDKELTHQLIEAREAAIQSNQAKSEFLSRMSHEIRTPMNAIIGMAEIARKSDDIERIRECLERVDDASVHLLGVINDILDMSKIEAGKFELSDSDFVLEHMLQRISNVNNFRFEQKHQHFVITVDPRVPTALVMDQQRLAQVITNLLSNATKFTPNEGNISLNIQYLGEEHGDVRLRFEVRDEGIGMTEEQQSRLFQAFEQADGTITRRFGGTGLGLAISKTIVELMDGKIWVESAPGQGSLFVFTARAKRGCATRSSYLSPNVDWSKVKLLAVDQSEDVRTYFTEIMRSIGIACDAVPTGGEAIERLRQDTYQIVFIDGTAQANHGMELARQVRGEFGDQVAVIMISASEWEMIEQEAKAAGVEHFVSKPLLPSPIIDCINICFGEHIVPQQISEEQLTNTDIFLGRKLLLVEDIDINRDIINAMLEETGVEIMEAENGQVAGDIFRENPGHFDMIFMDIHMPVMDGYEATQAIRSLKIPEAKAVPIIAMTANVFREDVERCLAAGMNDHIGKPVNADEMIAKMKRYMPVGR